MAGLAVRPAAAAAASRCLSGQRLACTQHDWRQAALPSVSCRWENGWSQLVDCQAVVHALMHAAAVHAAVHASGVAVAWSCMLLL